jgi:ribonuclease R
VTKNSALDKNAYSRGTSIYYANQVIPMLPFELSNELCSLKPHVNRLAMTVEMLLDDKGNLLDSNFYESVIKSKYRMTYTDCNKMLEDNDVEIIEKYSEVYPMLLDMYRLSRLLHNVRNKRGSLDFDVPEGKIIVNELGEVVDVVLRERGTSERIIEEFMLLANETVASTINHIDLPFIYRVHDSVNLLKLKDLQTMFNICGYKFNIRNKIHVKEVQKLLSEIKDEDAYLKTQLLRLMAKKGVGLNVRLFGFALFLW